MSPPPSAVTLALRRISIRLVSSSECSDIGWATLNCFAVPSKSRSGRHMSENESQPIGRVLGTESSTPLEWWVAIEPDQFLQLDDVVLVETSVPGAAEVRISGVVDQVRAQHEGSRFESDVFLAERGVLPLEVARSAHVVST